MKRIQILVIITLCLLWKSANGLYCVKCDSSETSKCGDVMSDDAALSYLVKCPYGTQSCRKVTQQTLKRMMKALGGTQRYVRDCGGKVTGTGCKVRRGYFGIKYLLCHCDDGDACNRI